MSSILKYKKTITAAVLSAGLMDTTSGLLLIFAPALALGLMGVDSSLGEALIFIRFIGAFVFAVGMLYLMAGVLYVLSLDIGILTVVLTATAWMRAVIFLFTTTAILLGGLTLDWWSVPLTDGVLAILQVIFVWKVWSETRGALYVLGS